MRLADAHRRTLVEVYLGRDASQRVLSGRISRGVAERINAVLWYSDLRGYTKITDTAPPDEIIPLLNDYAEAVISAIHEAGGEVLKLIGDGVLAIFRADDPRKHAAAHCRRKRPAVRHQGGERTPRAGNPVTSVYLGLHIGEVFYGNIGSEDRLDFTVVGPGRQRSESHSRDVPVGRPQRRAVVGIHRGDAGAGAREARFRGPLCAARCRPCRGMEGAGPWHPRVSVPEVSRSSSCSS